MAGSSLSDHAGVGTWSESDAGVCFTFDRLQGDERAARREDWLICSYYEKLLKVLLLPVAFVLFFIRWVLEASVKLTEWAVGLLTLIVGAAIIYSIVIHRWGDLFLYSLIFAGILAILMAVVVVQDFCSSMLEKISML